MALQFRFRFCTAGDRIQEGSSGANGGQYRGSCPYLQPSVLLRRCRACKCLFSGPMTALQQRRLAVLGMSDIVIPRFCWLTCDSGLRPCSAPSHARSQDWMEPADLHSEQRSRPRLHSSTSPTHRLSYSKPEQCIEHQSRCKRHRPSALNPPSRPIYPTAPHHQQSHRQHLGLVPS
jgi:hypothetical protein